MWIPVTSEVPRLGKKVAVILGEDAPDVIGSCCAIWLGFDDDNLPHWATDTSGSRRSRIIGVVTHWQHLPDTTEITTIATKLVNRRY
jgi:hypothetical protein